jgi:hypothetical protein
MRALQLKTGRRAPYMQGTDYTGKTRTMTPQALERGRNWLEKGALRPTRQRLTLASLLVGDGQDRHVTAEGPA